MYHSKCRCFDTEWEFLRPTWTQGHSCTLLVTDAQWRNWGGSPQHWEGGEDFHSQLYSLSLRGGGRWERERGRGRGREKERKRERRKNFVAAKVISSHLICILSTRPMYLIKLYHHSHGLMSGYTRLKGRERSTHVHRWDQTHSTGLSRCRSWSGNRTEWERTPPDTCRTSHPWTLYLAVDPLPRWPGEREARSPHL